MWDIETGKLLNTLKGHSDWVNSVSILPDGKLLASASYDTTIKIWDTETGKNVLTMLCLDTTKWVAWTKEGYYDCSQDAAQYVSWRVGNKIFSFEQYEKVFHRPDQIRLALQGKSLEPPSVKIAKDFPPVLKFIDIPAKTDKTSITINIEYKGDNEFKNMMMFHNGRPLNFDINNKSGSRIILTASANLLPNFINTINAVAIDSNDLQSKNIVQEIECGNTPKFK